MPLPALLIPVLTTLASKGLDLIGNAILTKGKDVVEKELGVNIESSIETEEGLENLRQLQFTHEEKLVELALQGQQLDLDYYKTEVADRSSAREREVQISVSEDAAWLSKNMTSILALIVVIGMGAILAIHNDTDVKFAANSAIMLVLGYYFGTNKSSGAKDSTIQQLASTAKTAGEKL